MLADGPAATCLTLGSLSAVFAYVCSTALFAGKSRFEMLAIPPRPTPDADLPFGVNKPVTLLTICCLDVLSRWLLNARSPRNNLLYLALNFEAGLAPGLLLVMLTYGGCTAAISTLLPLPAMLAMPNLPIPYTNAFFPVKVLVLRHVWAVCVVLDSENY